MGEDSEDCSKWTVPLTVESPRRTATLGALVCLPNKQKVEEGEVGGDKTGERMYDRNGRT